MDTTLFFSSLGSVFGAIATLFLVALLGFIGVRRRIVDDSAITGVTRLLVDIIVPARILSDMIIGLDSRTVAEGGVVMLVMVGITVSGLGIGWVLVRAWPGKRRAVGNRALIAMSGLHNGVYLPLPLMLAILPPGQHPIATIYIGAVFICMSMTQWTIGVYLLQGESHRSAGDDNLLAALRGTLTAPMIATFVGVALAFFPPVAEAARAPGGPAGWIKIPLEALKLMGSALPPVAMITLGLLVGQARLRHRLTIRAVAIPTIVRSLLTPLAVALLLIGGPLAWVSPVLALTIIIQASAPPATNLAVIARRYDGDWELISSVNLVTYGIALLAMPIWAALILTIKPL